MRLIDPTCGSGHFLLGAFQRLFARWNEREPGTTVTVLAQRALDAVHGVDLNPYAVAIARFRLVVAALKASGIHRLAEAPAFKLQLATGDSLLHGAPPGQLFGGAPLYREGIHHHFASEDAGELERILGQGYHAVVGNPPYIVGDDAAAREAYRKRYVSCHREYALTVPFMERFFELAQLKDKAGFVGKITGNNFMKREFGQPLVDRFLTKVWVTLVVDLSGAYVPGHGTPTLLLFGRPGAPRTDTLRVVDGKRGEPAPPEDPARGLVWQAIERLVDRSGEEDRFVRVSEVSRAAFLRHPMSLGPGREIRERIEREQPRLSSIAEDLGYTGQTNIDDAMLLPRDAWRRRGVSAELAMGVVVGDAVRDWALTVQTSAWFPYSGSRLRRARELGDALRTLWPWRTVAWERRTFAKRSYKEEGRPWYEWHQIALRRHETPLSITWGEVTSHNHFTLDRGGNVFNRTAPIVKLPALASEQDHLALLGVLNSSIACFWLKQVCQSKGNGGIGGGIGDESWEPRYAFNAANVAALPVALRQSAILPAALDRVAAERNGAFERLAEGDVGDSLQEQLARRHARDDELTAQMISLQEELDWQVLAAYGLVSDELPVLGLDAPPIELGQRAFEIVLARQVEAGETETTWFERHGSTPTTEVPADWPVPYRDVVERRVALIESHPDIGLIERPEHKRRWVRKPWEERQREALTRLVLDALEQPKIWQERRLRSTAELTDSLRRDARLVEALELLAGPRDEPIGATLERLVLDASVPPLAAQRLTEKAMAKRVVWERVWERQRVEDRIDARTELPPDDPQHLTAAEAERLKAQEVGRIPVPPRYARADFRTDAGEGTAASSTSRRSASRCSRRRSGERMRALSSRGQVGTSAIWRARSPSASPSCGSRTPPAPSSSRRCSPACSSCCRGSTNGTRPPRPTTAARPASSSSSGSTAGSASSVSRARRCAPGGRPRRRAGAVALRRRRDALRPGRRLRALLRCLPRSDAPAAHAAPTPGRTNPAMSTLLRDVITIPETVHKGDFVMSLAEGVADQHATLADYVVTAQLADAFNNALGFIASAVREDTSKAAYLDGSFGSGKSHFMAVLHLLLQRDPEARGDPGARRRRSPRRPRARARDVRARAVPHDRRRVDGAGDLRRLRQAPAPGRPRRASARRLRRRAAVRAGGAAARAAGRRGVLRALNGDGDDGRPRAAGGISRPRGTPTTYARRTRRRSRGPGARPARRCDRRHADAGLSRRDARQRDRLRGSRYRARGACSPRARSRQRRADPVPRRADPVARQPHRRPGVRRARGPEAHQADRVHDDAADPDRSRSSRASATCASSSATRSRAPRSCRSPTRSSTGTIASTASRCDDRNLPKIAERRLLQTARRGGAAAARRGLPLRPSAPAPTCSTC